MNAWTRTELNEVAEPLRGLNNEQFEQGFKIARERVDMSVNPHNWGGNEGDEYG